MSFVNERVSATDADKYGLNEIDRRYVVGGTSSRDWAIDRERGVYLRYVRHPDREGGATRYAIWHLFWKGEIVEAAIESEVTGIGQAHRTAVYRLVRLALPPLLQAEREGVIALLTEALQAYGSAGVHSKESTFSMSFVA